MNTKKIIIGCDHAGYELKEKLKDYLTSMSYEVIDVGCHGLESVDYPTFGFKVGEAVANNEATYGVVVCGSGIGISIAANKVKGVRCANVFVEDHARLARLHNNANVIAFGARIVGSELAKDIVKAYLEAEFMGGRHQMRVDMISDLEK